MPLKFKTYQSAPPTYAQWQNNTNPKWWKDRGLRMNMLCVVTLYLGIFVSGYDGSLLNGLQAMSTWQRYFDSPTGNILGLISASAYFPTFIATPFIPWACDRFSRRPVIFFGCSWIVVGAIVNALANGRGMFIAGRAIIGFGNNFKTVGCICLLTELAHPRLRHISAALYMCTFYIGSSLAAWLTFGFNGWNNDWAWRLPLLLQCVGPAVLMIACFFIPESPRWLASKGREEEAHAILLRFHANGAETDELVEMEMMEIRRNLEVEKLHKTTWKSLFQTPGNRKRLAVIIIVATGTQWNGVGIISYYLAPVLRSVGVTDNRQIAAVNGGLALFNLVAATAAAQFVERLGRRPLWIISTIGMLGSYIVITGLAGSFASTGNSRVGLAVIPFLFIYYGFYDMAWTPLSYAYCSEILPFALRAKVMSVYAFTQNIALAFNQWVNPVALKAIAWKFYAVYVGALVIYLGLVWWLFAETKGLTIEETGLLFDNPKGVRKELMQAGTQPEDGGNDDIVDKIDVQEQREGRPAV